MSEYITPVSLEQNVRQTSPGMMLVAGRKSQGLRLEEVVEQLHLDEGIVRALERDEYEKITYHTFIRGYLRAYANLLKLDGDEVITCFNDMNVPNTTPRPTSPMLLFDDSVKQHRLAKWIGLGVIVVLLGLVMMWWQGRGESPAAGNPDLLSLPVQTSGLTSPTNIASTEPPVSEPTA